METDQEISSVYTLMGFDTQKGLERASCLSSADLNGPDALAESLPAQTLLLAYAFSSEDCVGILSDSEPFSTNPGLIDNVESAFRAHFGWLLEREDLREAILIANRRSTSDEDSSWAPFCKLGRVALAPMLNGRKPPFKPLIRFCAFDTRDEVVVDEILAWEGAIFLAESLVDGVASHSEGVVTMAENGQVELAELEQLYFRLGNIRSSIERLRSSLPKPSGEEDDQGKGT